MILDIDHGIDAKFMMTMMISTVDNTNTINSQATMKTMIPTTKSQTTITPATKTRGDSTMSTMMMMTTMTLKLLMKT